MPVGPQTHKQKAKIWRAVDLVVILLNRVVDVQYLVQVYKRYE